MSLGVKHMDCSFFKTRILNQFGVIFFGFSLVCATCSFAKEPVPPAVSQHFNVRSFGAVFMLPVETISSLAI
jgi:hypothetical protein